MPPDSPDPEPERLPSEAANDSGSEASDTGRLTLSEIPQIVTETPQQKLMGRLCLSLGTYLDESEVGAVQRAYEFADRAHAGQFRRSGAAYICHPVSVALILAETMRMDVDGIIAALLHDVIEDTEISKETIEQLFGTEVAELVDAVTKLTRLDKTDPSRAEAQAENMQRMFLKMGRDLRVIIVKLADRMHNMRTLDAMPKEKKVRISTETLEIYGPIAHRLGMEMVCRELEEQAFKNKYPWRYGILDRAFKKARGNRREVIKTIESTITKRLSDGGLIGQVIGREKNLYSIYCKMKSKKLSFKGVMDLYAFRVVVTQVEECYRALGLVHGFYQPVPGRVKDYIAIPKKNGYRSLHTSLGGPYGLPLEIQIRTREMHGHAEFGIAAHWLYKRNDGAEFDVRDRAHEWIRDLLDLHENTSDCVEFIKNLKVDLFSEEIYVFTPKGKVIKLPRGATVVDFAYAVHTNIGNRCYSGRVNQQEVPLQTVLHDGQTVEVSKAAWTQPKPQWLKFVVTVKARTAILHHLKNLQQKDAVELGKRLLEIELNQLSKRLENVDPNHLAVLLEQLGCETQEQLLEEIGLGNRLPQLIAIRLCQDDPLAGVKLADGETISASGVVFPIKGTQGMVVNLAKCCHPILGDPIIGFFVPGKGIMIHLHDCSNLGNRQKAHYNWLDVEWSDGVQEDFSVKIAVEVRNQRGVLATITKVISEMNSNIEDLKSNLLDDQTSVDMITLSVRDRTHLARLIKRLKSLAPVLKVARV